MIAGAFSSTSGKADIVLTTNGDVLYYNSGRQRLAIGSEGKVLTVSDSDLPAWETAAGLSSPLTSDLVVNDNINLLFGTGSDASFDYDGTNLIINPKVVGSGQIIIQGELEPQGGTKLSETLTKRYEDFFCGDSISVLWTQANVAGSSTFSKETGINEGVRITTADTSGNGGYLWFNDQNNFNGASFTLYGICKYDNSSALMLMGVSSGSDPANNVRNYALLEQNTGVTNIQLKVGDNSTPSRTATDIATSTNVVTFKITSDGSNVKLYLLVSSAWVLKATDSSDLPTGAVQPIFEVATQDASTAVGNMIYLKLQDD